MAMMAHTLHSLRHMQMPRCGDEYEFGVLLLNLRDILLDDNGILGGRKGTESVWRSRFYTHNNGDLYPTHALGPLCMILGIGKNDQLAWLTSFATKAVGLRQRMPEHDTTTITLGDIVSTQIETKGGTLISLTHDTTLPRPRSLDFEVQGSRIIYCDIKKPHDYAP